MVVVVEDVVVLALTVEVLVELVLEVDVDELLEVLPKLMVLLVELVLELDVVVVSSSSGSCDGPGGLSTEVVVVNSGISGALGSPPPPLLQQQ